MTQGQLITNESIKSDEVVCEEPLSPKEKTKKQRGHPILPLSREKTKKYHLL